MDHYEPLTDEQWKLLEHLFLEPPKRGRGKPHAPWRYVVNSILFVLTTGSKWSALPKGEHFATKSAAHRWFLLWDKNGLIDQIIAILNQHLQEHLHLRAPARRNRLPKPPEEVAHDMYHS